jgi:hypothetical protein
MNLENSDFQKFSTYFTSDAWQLIRSFLNNLQTKMDHFNIAIEEQTTILSGIEEYILEFIENYKDRAKITFTESISLIQEIGSPSEILRSMDIPFDQTIKPESVTTQIESITDLPTYNKVICRACNWSNEPDSRFCDHCGVRIGELTDGRRELRLPRIPYELIESPYISGFLLAYLMLIFGGILNIIITYSPSNYPNLDYIPELYRKLSDTPPGMIIPAIIIGLVMGYIIKRFYSDNLLKYRYDVHLTHLQKYFFLGLVLTIISLWLFFIYVPIRVTRDELITLFIFLTITCIIFSLWIYRWNSTKRPSDIPYLIVLRHVKGLEEDNFRKIISINLIGGLGIFLLVFVFWSPIMPWNVVAIPAWIILIISLIILLNGVLLINYYSWLYINRFIGFSKQQSL